MMNTKQIQVFIFIFMIPLVVVGQLKELSLFENLVDKTWIADGKWENGSPFKQEVRLQFDLQGTLVIANTKGIIGELQTESGDEDLELGNRNHGVRQYNGEHDEIRFWEFDFFGNVTEGIVFAEGNNIIYQYNYDGLQLTDMWEYIDDSTYNFKVGVYNNGKWKQLFLNTTFKAQK